MAQRRKLSETCLKRLLLKILDLIKSDCHKLWIINRWYWTIKKKLTSYFDANDKAKWIYIINNIVWNYTNSVNRGIRYKPLDVNDYVQNIIRQIKTRKSKFRKKWFQSWSIC